MLYRWRVRPANEDQFVEAWSSITRRLREERGSWGSRAAPRRRRVSGTATRSGRARPVISNAFLQPVDEPAAARMREAVVEDFPPVTLQPVADFLVSSR